jgi:DNA-binding CsgD family transcriptional regulator
VAYVSQERFSDASRVLSRLGTGLDPSARPVAAAVLARSRALLEPENFERHMADALRWHAESRMPFERARTELRLGSHLRRHRQRVKARPYLDSALITFGRLDASPWRERTLVELEATGVHLGERRAELGRLTPQEFQVAQYVARGLSNREVATAMFLSVKTVEYHLGNTFNKLGVHRRSQLTMLLAQHDPGSGIGARGSASTAGGAPRDSFSERH